MDSRSEKKNVTRRHILDAAGELFRERGFIKSSVADVMERAGLTVGGFYAHFDSKEELLLEVLSHAFDHTCETLLQGLDHTTGAAFAREVTRRYLSGAHRDGVARGCPLPTLAAEVRQQGESLRTAFERYLKQMAALLEERVPPAQGGLTAKELALALSALFVGGILLARAVRDETLSAAILRACRRLAAVSVEPPP